MPVWERACSRRGQLQRLISTVVIAAGLTACTVGPDFQKPVATQIADWAKPAKSAPGQAVSEPLNERWWEVFHDPQLSALTQRAVHSNLDLQLASSRLQQSRAARRVIGADRYPNTAATAGYGRERNSAKGLSDPSGHNGDSAFNLWDAGLSASWELDVWGRVRRETEAADANLEVAEAAAQVAAIESRLPALEQRQSQLINAISLLLELTAYNASQRRAGRLAEAVRQNQIALRTAQRQYVEGVVDFVNVLTVQSALLATQEQWVESSTAVSLAMVGLYRALGGGWESVYPVDKMAQR
ncbi:TolC family protein [Pseudomonas sp. NPDC087614]|uniref:TolC family protein n=1 Tax=Pseudomonas sp. NPDC087614 TaxID=3364442 RepID=UPI00380A7FEE